MNDHYEGNWVDGQKSGQGTEYYKNGAVYVGEFADGKRHGTGVYTFPAESQFEKYDGEWEDDRPNGAGTKTLKNGEKFTGTFVNWSLTGSGDHFSAEGKSLQKGKWEDDTFLAK